MSQPAQPLPASAPDDTEPSVADLIAGRPQLSLHALDGLVFEDVPLLAIADELGTPCWVYGAATMRGRYRALRTALDATGLPIAIHYAVKANDHLAVLGLFGREGAGADVVSGGELLRARRAGIDATHIVFSGVGKTEPEIRLALAEGIGQFNVESAEELAMLSAIADGMGQRAPVALRVNPDIDAGTHPKITTGRAADKFGIAHDEVAALYAHAATLPGIAPVGLAVHIGSQIGSAAPFRAAFTRLATLVTALRAQGHAVERIDCGGGLGIAYRDEHALSPAVLAGAIRTCLGGLDVRLMVEPGRWLVGPAGLLLASVILRKTTPAGDVLVLDAAMNDLVRPAMYDAWHGIVPLSPTDARRAGVPISVVGPICESGDTFAPSRVLPRLASGARVAILDAGAYGAVMSSLYNARPLAPIGLVDGSHWHVIRARQSPEAMWAGEREAD